MRSIRSSIWQSTGKGLSVCLDSSRTEGRKIKARFTSVSTGSTDTSSCRSTSNATNRGDWVVCCYTKRLGSERVVDWASISREWVTNRAAIRGSTMSYNSSVR